MIIDEKIIERVSSLARLVLAEEEKEEYARQLNDIVSYVEKINELDTSTVEPADHIVPMRNVFREDIVSESMDIKEIERIAPEFNKNHIIVPPVLEGIE